MMDPEKIEIVKNWKVPTKILHVQQFIGLCGFYRKFIENFAKIAAPLNSLLKKYKKRLWTKDFQEIFEKLINCLILYPIQATRFQKPFALHTDACGVSLGAILTQTDENLQRYVVAYSSRLLKGA